MTLFTQRFSGFTLPELMVVVVIVGILSALALPSFSSLIRDNKLSAQANDFILAISLARSEAMRRGNVVCVKSKGSDGSWSEGWQVFEEKSADTTACATLPASSDAAPSRMIQDYDRLSGGNTLKVGDPFKNSIRFNRLGVAVDISGNPQQTQDAESTPAPDNAFRLCPADGVLKSSRLIGISVTGRPYPVMDNTVTPAAPQRAGSCP